MGIRRKLSDRIREIIDEYDFEDAVEEALDEMDLEGLVGEAIEMKLQRINMVSILEDWVRECIGAELMDIDLEDEVLKGMEDIL